MNSTSRGANACAVVAGSNGNALDCTFNGSASTGAIQAYQWEYFVGTSRQTQRTTTPTTTPQAGCGFLGGQAPQNQGGVQFIQMDVRLRVEGAGGVLSSEVRNLNVRLFPNNTCGYGF